uniref:Putative mitochondrial ribosomal protein s34 n=1 Tax=Rhipicephalus pulchellus TaxID=72859 RepID=L7LVC0_RHIPC
MPRIKYIGYPSPYVGKHLLWLLGNLKNFGVGRVVTRTSFERYPEPSYYVITKVRPYMDDANQYGDVWAETVFRGRRLGVIQLESPQVPDYKLVPKSEEARLLSLPVVDPVAKVLPRYLKMPPLMRIIVERDLKAKGLSLPVVDPVPKVLPRYLKMPPLMRIIVERDLKAKGVVEEPKLRAVYSSSYVKSYRIAEEGETPDFEHTDMKNYITEKFRQGIKEI